MGKRKKQGTSQKATPQGRPTRHLKLMVIPEPEPETRSIIKHIGEGTVVMRIRLAPSGWFRSFVGCRGLRIL